MYALVFIVAGLGGWDSDAYVMDSGLSWYECQVSGVVAQSFAPETIWQCEAEVK